MTLHVIGAGLAGLACALGAADAGLDVVVHEAARLAGGRCRSWDDAVIGSRIDNGTHVVVGGNPEAMAYLRRIGSADSLLSLPLTPTIFDLEDNATLRPGMLALAGAVAASLWTLAFDDSGTVAGRLGGSRQFRTLWEPLAVATLNTGADVASAALFRRVLAATLWRGAAASRMHVAREDLSASFVAPALTALAARGVELRFGHPLREPVMQGGKVAELVFDDGSILLNRHDIVVLAVPWWTAAAWLGLPELPSSPIANLHFLLGTPPATLHDHATLGLVGGAAQWVFRRGSILAVTISAASGLDEMPNEEIAAKVWGELARALNLNGEPLATRVIKEKRATLLHTSETESLRPSARQGDNLLLAGDWIATGLPCTIESAIRSGNTAARLATALTRERS